MMRSIRDYDVFKLSHRLAVTVYKVTNVFPKTEVFGLISQTRRSAYSIPMNLVEGAARRSPKEFARFVDIAIGSCEEVRYQLYLACELDFIGPEPYQQLESAYEKVKMMLSRLLDRVESGQR